MQTKQARTHQFQAHKWFASPPEFVPSKQVSLPVLPKVEGGIDLLQVSGEIEAGETLGIASLQFICFVDPHLIAWVGRVCKKTPQKTVEPWLQ